MSVEAELYTISNEHNITQLLEHFDSDYILSVVKSQMEQLAFSNALASPNIVNSYEEVFKTMLEKYPGDSANINSKRADTYTEIIRILCEKFGLRFNFQDESIPINTAALYAYDFLMCNRNKCIIDFFTAFIVNNKDALYHVVNSYNNNEKKKSSTTMYAKQVYTDPKYVLLSASIETIIKYMSTLDISLNEIFRSIYPDPRIVEFMNNAFSDTGSFFKTYYCNAVLEPSTLPIVITEINIALQSLVGVKTNIVADILQGGN